MRLVWTPRYLRELDSIGDYIAERNPRAAAKVVRVIHQTTARLLSVNPHLGRNGEIADTRELVISGVPYIVAYRITDRQIEVLFVQHAARKWPDEA
ncbi:type II toxin-antitoxin system RelE/ParE family toxin [Rhizobium rhizogenes]|uniref:Type II toxin-antitoxin system RelE/ParE family toxin n=1 Tax=Rhizobium rhizogenes TaxID=359 RepID=A0AA88JS66_RHIRH|nr:type II toxin-antitoxin system RelE/ParE family toxin [Rhizobium rhizogenes]KAA3501412.1 type II toxin-antitoxin system RelE/ParE family toxin [Rhizobium rhizogenes]